VFISGLILNLVFVVNFQKQTKDTDKEFKRWREKKPIASGFFLAISGVFSLTLYRLIFCRLFRLEMMSVRVKKPEPFLRPIKIFTWIKMLCFNLPLVVIDIYGINNLSWGNQCYMTMIESLVLSFISLALMVWEHKDPNGLITREQKTLNLDKLESLDDIDKLPLNSSKTMRTKQSRRLVNSRTAVIMPEEGLLPGQE